jgi:MFS family permease
MNHNQTTQNHKRALGIIFLTTFIDLVGFSIIFPLFPAIIHFYMQGSSGTEGGLLHTLVTFTTEWARNKPELNTDFCSMVLAGGILGSIYSFLQFIFAPIWGRISDRVGRRPVLLYTLLGTCLSYLIWVFSHSFSLFLIARIIGGTAAANISVATASIADLTSKNNRTKGMALIGIAFSLGFIIGPTIGGLCMMVNLVEHFPQLAHWGITPISMPALFAFVLSFANYIWAFRYFPETLLVEKRIVKTAYFKHFTHLFRIKVPLIRRICFIYFIFILIFSGMEFTLTFLALERLNYSPVNNGLMYLYIGCLLTLVQGLLVRKLTPIIGEKRTAIIGLVSGCMAFYLLSTISTPTGLYTALIFLAICGGCTTPALSSMVSLTADSSNQGHYIGNFRSIGALGRALGPILGASGYFYFGSNILYVIGSLCFIPALVSAFSLPLKSMAISEVQD